VRSELARRHNAIALQQQAGVAPPLEAPRARRLISAAGLAPTEPAWQQGNRRWHYVVGALALAASAMMFLLSRAGDTPPAAAATTDQAQVSTDRDRDVVRPHPVDPHVPVAMPNVALETTPPAAAPELLPISAPRPALRTSTHRSTTSPPPRISPRKAPVVPPGDQRLDPDGTLAPY